MKLALVLLLSSLGFADSTAYFVNKGGSLTGTNCMTLTGSTLTDVHGYVFGSNQGDLGSVSFDTGSLLSGNLRDGASFAPGGSITITGNSGILFTGVFDKGTTWEMLTLPNETHEYLLVSNLSGMFFNGVRTKGRNLELWINTGTGYYTGQSTGVDAVFAIATVPEPSSFGFLVTGLLGTLGFLRRRV